MARVGRLSFHCEFIRTMTWCRVAVHLWFAVMILASDRQTYIYEQGTGGLAVGSWLWLSAMPVLMFGVFRCARPLIILVGVHIAECAALMALAAWWGFSFNGVLWLTVIVLSANTALWGRRWLPAFAAVSATVYAATLSYMAELPPVWQSTPLWLDVWAVCGGGMFVLAICAVAHIQAQQLLGLGRHLREEKRMLLRYLPRDLPLHVDETPTKEIRRLWVTVVFVDLVGFTRATRELPTEALVELLNEFLACINEHVESWGGIVSKFLGDGVLCVFTAESSSLRKNSALQAVRCVCQLPGLIGGLNERLRSAGGLERYSVTCGIASGYCCAGDWGGLDRLDYTIVGPPVNLAQRLQDAAGRRRLNISSGRGSGVLLDETTHRFTAGAVPAAVGVTLTLKGLGRVAGYELPLDSPAQRAACHA